MTPMIHVELAGTRNCEELIDYLGARGLAGKLVETNNHCELEVGYAADVQQRLHDEVWDALRSWVAERGSPLVLAAVDDDAYVLRPQGE